MSVFIDESSLGLQGGVAAINLWIVGNHSPPVVINAFSLVMLLCYTSQITLSKGFCHLKSLH